MASSNENELPNALHTNKVVIVTGPTFGTALGFMVLGAALGAAATLYVQSRLSSSAGSLEDDDYPDLTPGDRSKAAQLTSRLSSLARRAKSLAGHAKEAVQSAAATVGPAISEAVSEARHAAQETTHSIEETLHQTTEAAPTADDPQKVG